MAKYYYKEEKESVTLYLENFYWKDIYRILQPDEIIQVKELVCFRKNVELDVTPQGFKKSLVYIDDNFVHPHFENLKTGQPLSFIKELIESENLLVFEYDVRCANFGISCIYQDDAVIEIPLTNTTEKVIQNIFSSLSLSEVLLSTLRNNQQKMIVVEGEKITVPDFIVQDFMNYMMDIYPEKYPELF